MSTSTRKKKSAKAKKNKRKKNWRTAATSDRHELYEMSVQDTEQECDLIDQVWKEQKGRFCHSIREDFGGTGATSMAFVARRKKNTAIAIDLDQEVLDWGAARLSQRLNEEQQTRFQMKRADVRTVKTDPVDSVLAMNFSYYIFQTRKEMVAYFRHVHGSLKDDGMFLLDAYGGSEAFEEMEEERDLDGFTYVWDQAQYNPLTGFAQNYIHFRFPDGTEMERAFSYAWRLWTLPEIQEMLEEAGFKKVTIYWEGSDEDGEGNGEWSVATEGEACAGWIAYIAAEK